MRLQIVSKLDHPNRAFYIGSWLAATAVLGVVMIGLVVTALLLPPFSIVQRWQRTSNVTPLGTGLEVPALSNVPSTDQATDNRDLPANMAPITTIYRLAPIDNATPTLHMMQLIVDVPMAFRESAVDVAVWVKGEWQVLPSSRNADASQRLATVKDLPDRVALVQLARIAPLVSLMIEPGQVLRPELVEIADVVEPAGMMPDAQGNLVGLMPNGVATGQGYAVAPILRCEDAELLTRLLTDQTLQDAHLKALVDFAVSQPYAGLVIDYRGLTAEYQTDFTAFLQRVAERLAESKRTLTVMLATNKGAYDWAALGQLANAVQIRLDEDALSFSATVTLITSEISRAKVQIILTSDAQPTLVNQLAIIAAANLAGVGVSGLAVEGDTSTVAGVITPYKLPTLTGQH